jgi:multisubunit Na+/H+ antiporter MnhB subunit
MYALKSAPPRPRYATPGLGATSASSSPEQPRDFNRELDRLRSRRAWDVTSLLVSGGVGVVSLGLFASGRYSAGYALAALSAIVGGTITLIRLSNDYDQQLEELRAAASAASTEAP